MSSRGQRPRKPDIPRATSTPKGSYPFRVAGRAGMHFGPGALPPAIHRLPFQGNRTDPRHLLLVRNRA